MEIIVCVKQVAETAEAELEIAPDGKSIKKEKLPLDINEWDNYALEEGLQLKEKFTGTVTAITVGSEDCQKMLRMCLAKGADNAIHIADEDIERRDCFAIARFLYEVIKVRALKYDLILTGVQTSDDSAAQVGLILAELLGIPHAAIVTKITIENIEQKEAKIERELEGGLKELISIKLPAVVTIQSGINEPRYASIIGIRKASSRELNRYTVEELNLKNISTRIQIDKVIIFIALHMALGIG